MGECGFCERSVHAGHAPSCKWRCKATTPDVAGTASERLQCERSVDHDGIHAVYDDEGEEIIRCWPNEKAAG